MAKAKKTAAEKQNAPVKKEAVSKKMEVVEDTPFVSKALLGNSRIWANESLAAKNKYFERYFYMQKNDDFEVGTKLFTDEELKQPFLGLESWIAISNGEGEHDPKWHAARVNNEGEILALVQL